MIPAGTETRSGAMVREAGPLLLFTTKVQVVTPLPALLSNSSPDTHALLSTK